jgi:hypothetical protein
MASTMWGWLWPWIVVHTDDIASKVCLPVVSVSFVPDALVKVRSDGLKVDICVKGSQWWLPLDFARGDTGAFAASG